MPAEITLDTLRQQADRMFSTIAELRLTDADRNGRDSDVHYGICSTLSTLGLIDHARVRTLELEIAQRCRAFYNGDNGADHA